MSRMKHATPFTLVLLITLALGVETRAQSSIPPGEPGAKAALEKSTRHGEYVDVEVPGRAAPLRAYVVYPESKDNAPVVIVIHEIFGLTDWVRSVADQLAADGFIAVAPDLLSGMGEGGKGTEGFKSRDDVTKAVRELKPDVVKRDLDAVRAYGKKLPASNKKTATIGFCWGGSTSFSYATVTPELAAAVVFYGTSPEKPESFEKLAAPVLGLYGSDDARVNKTIEPADGMAKKFGKSYTHHVYDGAGHGFLRQQDGRDGANMKASEQAWPTTIEFLKQHTK
jgi:carboxymethylenebutenolidase